MFDDEDDSEDDLADYFARHFMCPTAYIMLKGLDSTNEIVSFCGMSLEAASYAVSGIRNRIKKFNYDLFDYEIPLIRQLEPILLETHKYKIIERGDSMN